MFQYFNFTWLFVCLERSSRKAYVLDDKFSLCPFSIFLRLSNRMENIALDNEQLPSTNNDPKMTGDAVDVQVADQPQSNFTIMKNVVAVSFAFLLLFTSFQSLQNLQSSLNKDANIGLISLIIIYASLVLSCMFVPPAMIGRLGCKYTLMISMACYSAFTLANYYPRWYTLGFTSVLLGKFR